MRLTTVPNPAATANAIGAISGGIFSLNSNVFGNLKEFTGKTLNWIAGVGVTKRSQAYYSDKGHGALSAALAFEAALWIQDAILNASVRGQPNRLPQSLHYQTTDKYREWKQKAGFGSLYGVLTGSFGLSIRAIRNPAGGGQLVGIIPGKMSSGFDRAGRKGKPQNVSEYVDHLEHMRNSSQPLIAPLMSNWLQANFPVWGKAFEIYWRNIYSSMGEASRSKWLDNAGIKTSEISSQDAIEKKSTSESAEKALANTTGSAVDPQRGMEMEEAAVALGKAAAALMSTPKGGSASDTDVNLFMKALEEAGAKFKSGQKEALKTVIKARPSEKMISSTIELLVNRGSE